MDYDRLLNLTTDLGYQLMASGAEIYRVEESMHRVLNAYGLERPEVFAIPTCAGIYAARSHHWRMPRAWSPPWREGIPATRPIRY